MKNFLVVWGVFFGILLGIPTASSQSFEFETTRTPQTPGFFMIRIFPLEDNETIPVNPIFIKNYSEEESIYYEQLFEFIQKIDGTIIPPEDLKKYTKNRDNKIISLGQWHKDYHSFVGPKNEQILEKFKEFYDQHINGIVLRNITVDFGGNISDVLPSRIPDVTTKPIVIVGKFKKDMKTLLNIKGEIFDSYIEADEPLHLEDTSLSQSLLAPQIPDLWNELWKKEHPKKEDPKTALDTIDWLHWNNFFPILLFLLGMIAFSAAIRNIKKHHQSLDEKKNENETTNNTSLSGKEALKSISKGRAGDGFSSKEKSSLSPSFKKGGKPNAPATAPVSHREPFVDMPQIQDDD